jgi:hypothetical protein
MVSNVAWAILIGLFVAGCDLVPAPVNCGEVPEADCQRAVDAALPLFTEDPDAVVVLGTDSYFVVLGCLAGESPDVIDVLIDELGSADAQVRQHGPDIRHLCDAGPSG